METLFYRPGACALGPHILLEWLGIEYNAINAPRDQSFLAINPSGAVPALQLENGTIVTQCTAIFQYLCEAYNRPDLVGGSSIEARTEVWKWCSFLTGDLHPAFFPLFVPFRYTTDSSEESHSKIREAAVQLVSQKLTIIENHLQDRDYFLKEGLSVVDCYAVPMLRWAGLMLPDGRSKWPVVDAFYRRMVNDKGVKSALIVHGIEA